MSSLLPSHNCRIPESPSKQELFAEGLSGICLGVSGLCFLRLSQFYCAWPFFMWGIGVQSQASPPGSGAETQKLDGWPRCRTRNSESMAEVVARLAFSALQ